MSGPLSYDDARAVAAGSAAPLLPERVPLGQSIGRHLAERLDAATPIPHYASSAMDGWAIVGKGPWRLTDEHPKCDEACPIVTGACVPDGVTAVLRSESGLVQSGMLRSTRADEPVAGQHIRVAGGEAERGDPLIARGTVLNPAHAALAASAGLDDLLVQAEPEVQFVFTGDEVVTSGLPASGRVRDSFSVQLPQLFQLLGARAGTDSRIPDDLDATVDALRTSTAPMIVTTGGTGASTADHLRPALHALGADLLIDGVALRPGGPTRLARLPDGRLVVCLPGNPLAAMLAAVALGEPVIAALAGRPPRQSSIVSGLDLAGRPGVTALVPYAISNRGAEPVRWLGSAMMRGLADAAGVLVVPEAGVRRGARAAHLDLPWR